MHTYTFYIVNHLRGTWNQNLRINYIHRLITLWETGLPLCWVKNSVTRAPKCFDKIKLRVTVERKVPIQLGDLTGAFFILVIGVSLGAAAFLLEKQQQLKKIIKIERRTKSQPIINDTHFVFIAFLSLLSFLYVKLISVTPIAVHVIRNRLILTSNICWCL